MSKYNNGIEQADPWRVPVAVAEIPEIGLHREIEASPGELRSMAEVAGLREIASANAALDVTPMGGGRFHVGGRVRARVGQTCVVTLDPIENDIDEPVDLVFAPPEQIPDLAELVDDANEEIETPDPPEPIVDGIVDLGRLTTDALFLAIDPYPRRKDAVFEPLVEPADPDAHPFAALKALQRGPKAPGSNKPKKR
jgi:uncharacterized metal-binding protein YceD (DUF177 family)